MVIYAYNAVINSITQFFKYVCTEDAGGGKSGGVIPSHKAAKQVA